MARRSRWPVPRFTPRLTAGLVLALVVADLALVWLSVRHVRGAPPEPATGPAADRTRAEQPPPATATTAATGPLLLEADADGTVLRAMRGDCAETDAETDAETGPAALAPVELSTDAGRSFEPVDVGDPLVDVVRLSVTSGGDLTLVGVGQTCATTSYRSGDGGSSWAPTEDGAGGWQLSPTDPDRVRAPAGQVRPGCEVRALSTIVRPVARVLCRDGSLRGTADGGAEWVLLGSLDGAVDVEYTSPADAWALATTAGCAAAVLQTADGGVDWERTGCAAAAGDPLALSVESDTVTVQVGERVLVSTDGGRSFDIA